MQVQLRWSISSVPVQWGWLGWLLMTLCCKPHQPANDQPQSVLLSGTYSGHALNWAGLQECCNASLPACCSSQGHSSAQSVPTLPGPLGHADWVTQSPAAAAQSNGGRRHSQQHSSSASANCCLSDTASQSLLQYQWGCGSSLKDTRLSYQ